MVSLSEITSLISVFLLALGAVFVVWKILDKRSQKKVGASSRKKYAKLKKPLYFLHIGASGIASVISIIHGVTAEDVSFICKITGDIAAITVHVMFVMGVIMAVKSKWQPFNSELDAENKKARKIKWILTIITLIALTIHLFTHF